MAAAAVGAIAPLASCAPSPPEQRARALALLATTPAIDIHSHAGGVLNRRADVSDIGVAMREGGLSAICLALASDGIVIGQSESKLHATREPAAGELHAYMLGRLDLAYFVYRRARTAQPTDLG